MTRVAFGWLLFVAFVFAAGAAPLHAQTYPSKPIEIIVPFGPGGTSDLSVRFLSEKWSEFLGQPIVIVNKPGGGSAVGARYVATAKPDGYTLMLGSESPLLVVRTLQKNIDYDLDSFTFLFSYGKGAVFFTVRDDSRWKTMTDFLKEARERPGQLTYATHGIGTLSHFIAEVFWRENGVTLTHVPYKSGPEANTAVLGGHVDLAVPPSLGGSAVKGGVRVLATSGDERVPFAPDVPSLKELGYKTSLVYYSILVGPKGLPDDVKAKLIDAHRQTYAKYKNEIDERLKALELASVSLTGAQAHQAMVEREAWLRDIAASLGLGK